MSRTRIFDTIPEFNTQINNTDDRLQAISSGIIHHWERLGLVSADAVEWHNRRLLWQTDLYIKYSDPLQSTSGVKTQVRNFMTDFRTFANPLLNIMAASPNANSDDELVFNFKIGHAAPTHPVNSITDNVVFKADRLGGGDVQFTCRTSNDDHHASKAEGADSVQLAYSIMEAEQTTQPPTPIPANPSDDVPVPEDMTREIFTKAVFTLHLGVGNVGKKMIVYLRWYNTKHPDLAGPWTDISRVVIA